MAEGGVQGRNFCGPDRPALDCLSVLSLVRQGWLENVAADGPYGWPVAPDVQEMAWPGSDVVSISALAPCLLRAGNS